MCRYFINWYKLENVKNFHRTLNFKFYMQSNESPEKFKKKLLIQIKLNKHKVLLRFYSILKLNIYQVIEL